MAPDGFRLGVDFGTSNTTGVLQWPDGSTKPLLFDGSPLLPSAVYADPDGPLLTGRDALHAARARPECFEPNPKRRIDEGVVLLGEREIPVAELIAAVLARVGEEARRVTGGAPAPTTLTFPAGWGPRRRRILLDAATGAGLGSPGMVAEPVAAASSFVSRPDTRLPIGSCAVVYDFGGGTFDASVVRRTAAGFDVLAAQGLDDAGGLDIDEAIVVHLGAVYSARDAATWRRLTQPATPADRRANRLLREDIRTGKEMLSRTGSTLIHLPLLDDDAPLGREQFEQVAGPVLARTVAATWSTIQRAGITAADVSAVFLVGGSSRIPLAGTLLHRRLGVAPTAIEQPELVVAEGSLHAAPIPTEPSIVVAHATIPTPEKQEEPAPLAQPDGTAIPAAPAQVAEIALPVPPEHVGATATPAAPVQEETPEHVGATVTPAPPVQQETPDRAAGKAPDGRRHLLWGLLIGVGSLGCGTVAAGLHQSAALTACLAAQLLLYAGYRIAGPALRRQRVPHVLAGLVALVGVVVIVAQGSGTWDDLSYVLPVAAVFGIVDGLLEVAAALVGGPGPGRAATYAIGVVLLLVGAADAPASEDDSVQVAQAVTLATGMILLGLLIIVAGARRASGSVKTR